MNEILLPVVSFILGILATLASQLITRQLRITDARQKKKLEHLQTIREWMEAYDTLFECEYPDIWELNRPGVFIQKRDPLHMLETGRRAGYEYKDSKIAEHIYNALIHFRTSKIKYEEMEKKGCDALLALSEPDRREAKRRYQKEIEELDYPYEFGDEKIFSRGLVRAIAPHLSTLKEMMIRVFTNFPPVFSHIIFWEKLSDITYDDVLSVVILKYPQFESEEDLQMLKERDYVPLYKSRAHQAIRTILREIQKYEDRWTSS